MGNYITNLKPSVYTVNQLYLFKKNLQGLLNLEGFVHSGQLYNEPKTIRLYR